MTCEAEIYQQIFNMPFMLSQDVFHQKHCKAPHHSDNFNIGIYDTFEFPCGAASCAISPPGYLSEWCDLLTYSYTFCVFYVVFIMSSLAGLFKPLLGVPFLKTSNLH